MTVTFALEAVLGPERLRFSTRRSDFDPELSETSAPLKLERALSSGRSWRFV